MAKKGALLGFYIMGIGLALISIMIYGINFWAMLFSLICSIVCLPYIYRKGIKIPKGITISIIISLIILIILTIVSFSMIMIPVDGAGRSKNTQQGTGGGNN